MAKPQPTFVTLRVGFGLIFVTIALMVVLLIKETRSDLANPLSDSPSSRTSSSSAVLESSPTTSGSTPLDRPRRSQRELLLLALQKWGPTEGSPLHQRCSNYIDGMAADPSNPPKQGGGFASQCNEDWYLVNFFFDLERYADSPGKFVDCAAHHYMQSSNTFFLDVCMGWEGVCIEANPMYIDDLRSKRKCDVIDTCVSDSRHEVSFALEGGSGGIDDALYRGKDLAKQNKITLTCLTFEDAMDRSPRILKSNRFVDFMSLDVEGHELNILRGIDFTKTKFGIIILEEGAKTSHDVREILISNGYVLQTRLSGSMVFTSATYPVANLTEALKWKCACSGCVYKHE